MNIEVLLSKSVDKFKDTYKSDVKFNNEDSTINVTNIGGPLNHLENNWSFNETKEGTEIFFDIDSKFLGDNLFNKLFISYLYLSKSQLISFLIVVFFNLHLFTS